jgi:hypothetical protein
MQNGRLGGDGTSSRRAVAGSAGARQVLPAQAVAVAAWAEVVEPTTMPPAARMPRGNQLSPSGLPRTC